MDDRHNALREKQRIAAEATKLFASIDKSGSVVLHTRSGDIKLYVADGKMEVKRRDKECDDCTKANLKLAKKLAIAWNDVHREKARTTRIGNVIEQRPPCGGMYDK